MVINKVVARFKDSTLIKGTTNDFSPLKKYFHLELGSGEKVTIDIENLKIVEIDTEELKAAFFVKDFEGNQDYQEEYEDEITGAGKKVKVEFDDGEVIVGYVASYSPERNGFFLLPADLKGNNHRIFVVRSATKSITFL